MSGPVALEIWDARDPADRERWERLHAGWERREVFAHPAYVELFAAASERPLAAFAQTADGWILYPFLLRPIEAEDRFDITTPYGYGGPFRNGEVATAGADAFWNDFGDWARDAGVVSEFVRLSLFDDQLAPYPGERVMAGDNVVRELAPDPDELWRDYEHKVRKNVKRARERGVEIVRDERGERLADFLRIYRATMDRRGARGAYYFDATLFEGIRDRLGGQFAFFHAVCERRVVSTELALVSADNVYSFLGGTESGSFDLRPNDLLKHELILWARDNGRRRFVLGGGYERDDGIFRYKRSFAPGGVVSFETGRRILDPAAYERLVAARGAASQTQYFPAYRAPA